MATIPDELVQQLLENIETASQPYAKAKALVTSLEELRKSTKAGLMKMARAMGEASSKEGAEAWAYTHPSYQDVVDRLVAAIEDEVLKQTKFQNAEREWESWRTLCANERSATR